MMKLIALFLIVISATSCFRSNKSGFGSGGKFRKPQFCQKRCSGGAELENMDADAHCATEPLVNDLGVTVLEALEPLTIASLLTGSGLHDQSDKLQAMIDYFSAVVASDNDLSKKTIFIPNGRYNINKTITMKSGVYLTGSETRMTILQESANSPSAIHFGSSSVETRKAGVFNVTLDNIYVDITSRAQDISVVSSFFYKTNHPYQLSIFGKDIEITDNIFGRVYWRIGAAILQGTKTLSGINENASIPFTCPNSDEYGNSGGSTSCNKKYLALRPGVLILPLSVSGGKTNKKVIEVKEFSDSRTTGVGTTVNCSVSWTPKNNTIFRVDNNSDPGTKATIVPLIIGSTELDIELTKAKTYLSGPTSQNVDISGNYFANPNKYSLSKKWKGRMKSKIEAIKSSYKSNGDGWGYYDTAWYAIDHYNTIFSNNFINGIKTSSTRKPKTSMIHSHSHCNLTVADNFFGDWRINREVTFGKSKNTNFFENHMNNASVRALSTVENFYVYYNYFNGSAAKLLGLDTSADLITDATDYTWIYNDDGTSSDDDVSFWRPVGIPGYHRLGDFAHGSWGKPITGSAVLVKDNGKGGLAKPTGYSRKWTDAGSGGDHDVALWKPTAPTGYQCLGFLATNGARPSTNDMRCVKNSYLTNGRPSKVWDDDGSGADTDVGIWRVLASNSRIGIGAGTFQANTSHWNSSGTYKVIRKSYAQSGRTRTEYVRNNWFYASTRGKNCFNPDRLSEADLAAKTAAQYESQYKNVCTNVSTPSDKTHDINLLSADQNFLLRTYAAKEYPKKPGTVNGPIIEPTIADAVCRDDYINPTITPYSIVYNKTPNINKDPEKPCPTYKTAMDDDDADFCAVEKYAICREYFEDISDNNKFQFGKISSISVNVTKNEAEGASVAQAPPLTYGCKNPISSNKGEEYIFLGANIRYNSSNSGRIGKQFGALGSFIDDSKKYTGTFYSGDVDTDKDNDDPPRFTTLWNIIPGWKCFGFVDDDVFEDIYTFELIDYMQHNCLNQTEIEFIAGDSDDDKTGSWNYRAEFDDVVVIQLQESDSYRWSGWVRDYRSGIVDHDFNFYPNTGAIKRWMTDAKAAGKEIILLSNKNARDLTSETKQAMIDNNVMASFASNVWGGTAQESYGCDNSSCNIKTGSVSNKQGIVIGIDKNKRKFRIYSIIDNQFKHIAPWFELDFKNIPGAPSKSPSGAPPPTPPPTPQATLQLTSTGFNDGAAIPQKYVCTAESGQNISPHLTWSAYPTSTHSFAVIMDDEDCGSGTSACKHWQVYNIPSTMQTLAEDVDLSLTSAINTGLNYDRSTVYAGPCPPVQHTYSITVYALDSTMPTISQGTSLTRKGFENTYKAHIIGSGKLQGNFTP